MPSVAAYRILAEHESCRRSLQAAQTFLRKPAGATGFFLETSDSHSRVSPPPPRETRPDGSGRQETLPDRQVHTTERGEAPLVRPIIQLYNLFARHRHRKIFVSDRPHRCVRRKPHRKERFFPVCAELLPQPRPPEPVFKTYCERLVACCFVDLENEFSQVESPPVRKRCFQAFPSFSHPQR